MGAFKSPVNIYLIYLEALNYSGVNTGNSNHSPNTSCVTQ